MAVLPQDQSIYGGAGIPLKRKGAGLNQLIAKTHKLGGQLLGLQITNGNVIAVGFSAMQITAGVVKLAWMSLGGWSLALIPVCTPLAILIERLSLGGLMVFRAAGKQLRALEDEYYLARLEKEATGAERYQYERLVKRLKKDRKIAIAQVVLGVLLSGIVGDQIWQAIFQAVMNGWMLSLMIAATVSLTFVFSEMYAELSDHTIAERMKDRQIPEAVLKTSEADLQVELSLEAFGNLRSDPVKRLDVVSRIENGLTQRLHAFADRAEYLLTEGEYQEARIVAIDALPVAQTVGVTEESVGVTEESVGVAEGSVGVAEGSVGAKKRIRRSWSERKERMYESNQEEFFRYMERNPSTKLAGISERFDIARATASDWRLRYWAEKKGMSVGVAEGSVGVAEGSVGAVEESVGAAEGSVGVAEESVGAAEGSVGAVEESVGVAEGSVGVL